MTRKCTQKRWLKGLMRTNLLRSWKYDLTRIMDENGYTGSMLYTYEYGLGNARFWNDV